MKFFLRADASDTIGTGHVMRLFGLGEQLMKDDHEVRYFMAECPEFVLAKAPKGAEITINSEFDGFIPTASGHITVVDSYKLGAPEGCIKIEDHWFFLRDEIRQIRRGRTRCQNILISYGGGFAFSGSGHSDERNKDGLTFRVSSFATYAENLAWADVVVGAGGVSSLERAFLGIPSLVAEVALNQRANIDWLTNKFAAVEVPHANVTEQGKWISVLRHNLDLVKMMSEKAMRLVPDDSYQAFIKVLKEQVLS